jgi:hypothetical protein
MNTTKFKISARNAWDTVEIGPFNTREEAVKCLEIGWGEELIKEFKPLREIMVYYKNGGRDNAPFCTCVNMAAHLTDIEMLEYFAAGKVFNVGCGPLDLMAEVERAEIIL